jgi:hypothetical protein
MFAGDSTTALKEMGFGFYVNSSPSASNEISFNMPNLTDVTTCSFAWYYGVSSPGATSSQQLLFTNAALSAASVEHVLASAALTTGGGTPGRIQFGGTSAGYSSLSAAGQADRDALVADGWVITINP